MEDKFMFVANIDSRSSLHSMNELLDWIEERKKNQHVEIDRINLSECTPWYYDNDAGDIRNSSGSFFQITGIRGEYPNNTIVEQPIIIQKEIGFLGIICKQINGIWHFLMQAKIEPGNINYVQISPTIQATKSNFTRRHGGKEPPYLQFFLHMRPEDILVDQIQSEQSSRFLGKRNRNVIISTNKTIEETTSHRWMTLAQLKLFMSIDNCINMDTRTVLSCLPYVFMSRELTGYSYEYIQSVQTIQRTTIRDLYLLANNYKMFNAPHISFLPLKELNDWSFTDKELTHKNLYPFKVIFCGIEIEGREVTEWKQPLFEALGKATFGLICSKTSGILEILVQIKPEIGCFDSVELGPSVQEEYGNNNPKDTVATFFFDMLQKQNNILIDVVLSEEGGRFYHEENRNVIMLVEKTDVEYDETKYVWSSVGNLNAMTQINNCLNIQLRNLLMLLSMYNEGENV